MTSRDSLPSTCDFESVNRSVRNALQDRYDALQSSPSIHWMVQYRMLKRLGAGSQSVVWLADRMGAFNVSLRVALKLFSPAPYDSTDAYLAEMAQTAHVGMRIAEIQQDNLLDVHNIVETSGIQVMVMEWVDGFDLKFLLDADRMRRAAAVAGRDRWEHINDVVATIGPAQVRLKPGVAINVLRECLTGLAALHRRQIVHGDVKPSNIMLKRTGSTKLIDFGSAFLIQQPRIQPAWTPRYAAMEVLSSGRFELNSDLASLGYVFLELLAGQSSFEEITSRERLMAHKAVLHERLPDVLPADVAEDSSLLELIRRMIHPDPAERFQTPDDALLSEHGAAAAHRRLVLGDLSTEYGNEIREWLRVVPPADNDGYL